ncbi:hypothetical protein CA284_16440 [Enterobacter mori]|uniref:hypothetical protein n=1 Tax=Enterobacter mori TaxID=539813 RepID=UPI000B7C8FC9|nr:hypothetical protein [Enterobacter mori]OXL39180.1 hypothetical protein CA284_16440 [Enterobacter mori]
MLEGLYFWKTKNGTTSAVRIVTFLFVIVLLLCSVGVCYWYYFIKLPADEQLAQQQAAQKIRSEIASVNAWYEKSLDGVNINFGIRILNEIHRSLVPLEMINFSAKTVGYVCTTKSCNIDFERDTDSIMTQPEMTFFGKKYTPSFPMQKGKAKTDVTSLEYNNMLINDPKNDLLKDYKKGKSLALHSCNEIISYIKTYNSTLEKEEIESKGEGISFKTLPKSSVIDLEKRLAGRIKSYDMLSADWSMEVTGTSSIDGTGEILLQVLLYKQAYRDAFLIRKIETIKNGIKVSGGLVCKA